MYLQSSFHYDILRMSVRRIFYISNMHHAGNYIEHTSIAISRAQIFRSFGLLISLSFVRMYRRKFLSDEEEIPWKDDRGLLTRVWEYYATSST